MMHNTIGNKGGAHRNGISELISYIAACNYAAKCCRNHVRRRGMEDNFAQLLLLLLLLLCIHIIMYQAVSADGAHLQCDVSFEPDASSSARAEPTLSASYLEGLPGFTRSVYKRDHALITPESQVFGVLHGWTRTLGAYFISPAMGSHFSMYIANMEENATSGLPPAGIERFVFVIKGELLLSTNSGDIYPLLMDWFGYLPPNFDHSLRSTSSATIIVLERRCNKLQNKDPDFVVGATDKQPVLEAPGEVFVLRKLLPTTSEYDFNVHIMDFQPGEYLNVKEVHYNQHGLLLLEGRGIYRLGENWYPVQAGDVIWMAPYVPQWFGALGRTRSRYLLYKDVNRDPLMA